MSLSVIIIAHNNEGTIRRCLESVKWADEIVLVDSGSTDRTLEISRDLGARVQQRLDWPGHGPQKNRALDLATGEWVFSLDTDEWITPEVRAEIEAAMAAPGDKAAFMLPRRSSFCGRFMRHSGWWPDYVKRLFRRGQARFSDDEGHDRLIVNGTVGRLSRPIHHETITSLEQLIDKMNAYSAMTARNLRRRDRRASIFTALIHGGWAFFRTYFLRAGFLDGREGMMLAIANAENSYYRYVKLMLLAMKTTTESPPQPESGRLSEQSDRVDSVDVPRLLSLQERKTGEWHQASFAPSATEFLEQVEEEHHCNYELWHEEDKARRDDQGHVFVYRAKRNIDHWNQRRNDCIERIDTWLAERSPSIPEGTPMNSETPGMIIDRLSILALKEYHMAEEAERAGAPEAQRARCQEKLGVIRRQRADLARALGEMLAAIAQGTRGFRVYYQFKMYNDPALNPELYRK